MKPADSTNLPVVHHADHASVVRACALAQAALVGAFVTLLAIDLFYARMQLQDAFHPGWLAVAFFVVDLVRRRLSHERGLTWRLLLIAVLVVVVSLQM